MSTCAKPTAHVDNVKAGHTRAENQFFEVGFSKEEVATLYRLRARLFPPPQFSSPSHIIRFLVIIALAHYDVLQPLVFEDLKYGADEETLWSDFYFEQMIESEWGNKAHAKAVAEAKAGKGGAK